MVKLSVALLVAAAAAGAVLCGAVAVQDPQTESTGGPQEVTSSTAHPNKFKPPGKLVPQPFFGVEDLLGRMWPYSMDTDDSDDALEKSIQKVGKGIKAAGEVVEMLLGAALPPSRRTKGKKTPKEDEGNY